MNENDYGIYIEELIPRTFERIYAIDMLADLVIDYEFVDEKFVVKETSPFTSFYTNLENIIHPEDIKGYIDSISPKEDDFAKEKDYIRFEYRRNTPSGYTWFSHIVKIIDINGKKIALIMAYNINENIEVPKDTSDLSRNQNVIINAVSNAIVKLHNVMNINFASDNPEMKSMTKYVNNILLDLTNTYPELNEAMTANIIANANQGTKKTILVVDDDQMTCKLLAKTFEDTYEIISANDGQEAIDILEKNNDINTLDEKAKIVGMFLDLNMPRVDGFGVLDYMSSKNLLQRMPVIIISGDYDQITKDRAYLYPIADMLEKPFNVQVVKHRIKNFIKLYKSNNSLNEIVLNQHQDIKNVLKSIVSSYLYDYGNDIKRVSAYTNIIARQLVRDHNEYNFDENRIAKLTEASKYYHLGLYTLPHKMFKKQNFTPEEVELIKKHPLIGVSIFETALYRTMDGVFNHVAKDVIKYHEEKYDGTGYPSGIKENKIPIEAQIVSIAAEYNNLLKVMNESSVLEDIIKKSGTRFNPNLVESLKNCVEEIKKVNETM